MSGFHEAIYIVPDPSGAVFRSRPVATYHRDKE